MGIWVFLAIWFGLGAVGAVFVYGMSFAYWQRKFPELADEQYESDVGHALGVAILVFFLPFLAIIEGVFLKFGLVYGLKFR